MSPIASGETGQPGQERFTIFVVSDSLGETAEVVARAAASQFAHGRIRIHRIPHADSPEAVRSAIRQASGDHSILLYTIISPELRRLMVQEAKRAGIPTVDLLGPVLTLIQRVTGLEPRLQAGLLHRLDQEYFQRVEAMEFAVRYDDGRDPRGFRLADVVLLGVSRTSKTPVCMVLANHRIKAANLPLVPEVELPREIFEVPRSKLIGLTINPEQLQEIRRERLRAIGLDPSAPYGDMERILRELEHAEQVFRRLGCRVVDVSNRAVEETASRVMQMLGKEDG